MSRINFGGGNVQSLSAPRFLDAGHADGEGYGHGNGAGDGMGAGRLPHTGVAEYVAANERRLNDLFMRGA